MSLSSLTTIHVRPDVTWRLRPFDTVFSVDRDNVESLCNAPLEPLLSSRCFQNFLANLCMFSQKIIYDEALLCEPLNQQFLDILPE